MGSDKREVEDGMEESFEIEEQEELVDEADVAKDSETAFELQNSKDLVLTLAEPNPASNLQSIGNAGLESANTQSPIAANTSMPPEHPQELAASSIDDDTETIYPDDDDLEPYVFNWEDHAFIDATGHLDTYQRVHDANFDPSRQYLQHCHWVGLIEAYKPKQTITHYLGPVDASGQHQPILPVPELTVTTPEGDTYWLADPLPWNRLCMNRRWLSLNLIDDYGYLDTWKRVRDEERREQVLRGQRRLQRDNWVLSKFAPLEKRSVGVPVIMVTVPEGGTFYLDVPRSWADLDDDDSDW